MTIDDIPEPAPTHKRSWLDRITDAVAVLGGTIALSIGAIVVASVIGRWINGIWLGTWIKNATGIELGPVPGDFELVKMGIAVAVYTFLPIGQARRVNIVVDTFTGRWSDRTRDMVDGFWDLVYAFAMGLLTFGLCKGAIEYMHNGETIMMLPIVIWPAVSACAVFSTLLSLVALVTAVGKFTGRHP